MTYIVKLKKDPEGYAVWCPGLPGCWSQGQTEEEALENIQDAIREYLLSIVEEDPDAESRQVTVELKVA
jgi:predicted RNase H-like HicB family nuclease